MNSVLLLGLAFSVSATPALNRSEVAALYDTTVSGTCPEGDTFVIPDVAPVEKNYAGCSNIKHIVVKSMSHPGWVNFENVPYNPTNPQTYTFIPSFLDSLTIEGNFAEVDNKGGSINGFGSFIIRKLYISDNNIKIGHLAFVGVSQLDEVIIPATCTFITNDEDKADTFMHSQVKHLKFLDSTDGVDVPQGFCAYCSNLRAVEFEGKSNLGQNAFYGSSVELCVFGGQTDIDNGAFGSTRVNYLQIPASSTVQESAFTGVNTITYLSIGKDTSFDESAFNLKGSCGIEDPIDEAPFTLAGCEVGKSFDAPSADSVLGNPSSDSTDTEPYMIAIIALGSGLGVALIGLVLAGIRLTGMKGRGAI